MSRARKTIQRRDAEDGEVILCQRKGSHGEVHYEVVVNGAFLFSTYNRKSERVLAQLAINPVLDSRRPIDVLIGGLGVGYTLGAALEYHQVRSVTVVEKEECIVDWSRTYFLAHNLGAMLDPRVRIRVCDLNEFIRTVRGEFDSVCLDVDNGPEWLAWQGNEKLYGITGLRLIKKAMRQRSVVTVWSSRRAVRFEYALRHVFGNASVHPVVTEEMGRESEYYIYSAISG